MLWLTRSKNSSRLTSSTMLKLGHQGLALLWRVQQEVHQARLEAGQLRTDSCHSDGLRTTMLADAVHAAIARRSTHTSRFTPPTRPTPSTPGTSGRPPVLE